GSRRSCAARVRGCVFPVARGTGSLVCAPGGSCHPAGACESLFPATRRAGKDLALCGSKSFELYLGDELLRSGVERQFGTIGEALSRLDKQWPDVAATIPEHRKIIAFRNILIHG